MASVPVFPTRLLHMSAHSYVVRMQSDLARLQREVTTGRHDDLGLTLGTGTSRDISLRVHLSDVDFTLAQAKQSQPRNEIVQTSLDSISKLAKNFFDAVTGARSAADGQTIASTAARNALTSLQDILNTSYGGQYIFGGQNSSTPPMKNPLSGDADDAIATAFQTEFGIPRDDPAVSQISQTDLDSFLTGAFSQLFDDPSWKANWSNADDTNILQRVGSITIDTSANTNASFARNLTKAFSMIASLGEGNLSKPAFDAALDKATALVLSAQSQIGGEQTRIGLGQQRITDAIGSLELQKTTISKAINNLEAVDPYEAATEVNSIMTQLQSSYAVTARISQLSLLSYL